MQTTLNIYKNRSNPVSALFYEDLTAIDFSGATRSVLKLYTNDGDLAATVDSNDSPSLIATGPYTGVSPNTNNLITFTLNSLTLSGLYYAAVIVYDASHPNGQVIAHPESDDDLLSFNFVDA